MIRSKILPAAMAAVFALGATGSALASSEEHEGGREIAAALAAKTSIATAEQHTGGKAIEARVDDDDDTMLFKVKVAKDNAVHKVMVDGATGKVVRVKSTGDDEDDD
jgi:uncharacterized membrane protein YkoI